MARFALFCLLLTPLVPTCPQTRPLPTSRPVPTTLAELLAPPAAPLGEPHPQATLLAESLQAAANLASPEAQAALLRLKDLGPAAAPTLVDLLATAPTHARQAAAVLLGASDQPPGTLAALCRALADPSPGVALSAALSLRDRRAPLAAPRLLLEIQPPAANRSPALATAAATALLELGSPAGMPLLLAVLHAGIPGSEEIEARHGLPSKETWALEKEIALRALRRLSGKRFGLEPEQGWADQRQGAGRWAAWWEAEGAQAFPAPGQALREALKAATLRVEAALPRLPTPEATRARAWLKAVAGQASPAG